MIILNFIILYNDWETKFCGSLVEEASLIQTRISSNSWGNCRNNQNMSFQQIWSRKRIEQHIIGPPDFEKYQLYEKKIQSKLFFTKFYIENVF